jgi:phage terminase large subunit GpA-like protein
MTTQTDLATTLWHEERQHFRPPDRRSVSEWCDDYRVLDPLNCSLPGKWRTDFTPYLRGIMDAFNDHRCRDLVLMGGTQWGKTEAAINCLLWSAVEDPAPTLFVLPSQGDAESFAARRLRQALEHCDATKRMRGQNIDWKASEIALGSMVLYMGWSNSPSRLASRSVGRVFFDEVDKYPRFSGREADPISLGSERLRWWTDSKRWISSTPTTTEGYIWQFWEQSDQRWFYCPCPFCGHFQRLTFTPTTLVWPKEERDPVRIREHRLASYVCEACERSIPDDDQHKRRMLAGGVWCPEGGTIRADGTIAGVRTDAATRGFHVNALYSPVLTWSDVAAKFLESKDDVRSLMNFHNSWLGWPWVERSAETTIEAVRNKTAHQPREVVPAQAMLLTAGVDVQKNCLYYTIRAHWAGERSQTIEYGILDSFRSLSTLLMVRDWTGEDGRKHALRLVCIDSGYRTDEVYAFCLEWPDRARPIKGFDRRAVPIQSFSVERSWQGRAGGLLMWGLDTSYFKDKLTRKIHAQLGAAASWSVHAEPADEYLAHLTSEHRVLVRRAKGDMQEAWRPRPGGGPNHWLDCEVYQEAASDMLGLYAIRDAEQQQAMQAAHAKSTQAAERASKETVSRLLDRSRVQRGSFIRRRR